MSEWIRALIDVEPGSVRRDGDDAKLGLGRAADHGAATCKDESRGGCGHTSGGADEMNEIEHRPSTRWHQVDSELRAASTLLDLDTQAAMEWMKGMTNMWDYGESRYPVAIAVIV